MNTFRDIASYAFRGNGKYILFIGAVISVIADIASFAPTFGFLAMIVLSGYFCAIYFEVIQSTATGDDEAPDFPEITSFLEDVLEPLVQVVGVTLLSFGPGVVYWIFTDEAAYNPFILYSLLSFGTIYFPMAMLAVVILGSLKGMSPHIVIPAIFHGGLLYWIAVILLCLLYAVQYVTEGLFEGHAIIGTLVMAALGMFTLMTNGRILGILYRDREEELGWL